MLRLLISVLKRYANFWPACQGFWVCITCMPGGFHQKAPPFPVMWLCRISRSAALKNWQEKSGMNCYTVFELIIRCFSLKPLTAVRGHFCAKWPVIMGTPPIQRRYRLESRGLSRLSTMFCACLWVPCGCMPAMKRSFIPMNFLRQFTTTRYCQMCWSIW